MKQVRNVKKGDICIIENNKVKIEKKVKDVLFFKIIFEDGDIFEKGLTYLDKLIPVILNNEKYNMYFLRG